MVYREIPFESLKGKTFKNITVDKNRGYLEFTAIDDQVYKMYHDQECCEEVYIEDICGDLDDLINVPILDAHEKHKEICDKTPHSYELEGWTFYTLRTVNGTVDIRWYGSSNGYYGVEVNVYLMKETNSPRSVVIRLG